MKKIIIFLIVLVILCVLAALTFDWGRKDASLPAPISAAPANMVPLSVSYPVDNQTVESPIIVSGSVSPDWFSQGPFSVELVTAEGAVIATATAQSSDASSTGPWVNFSAQLDYAPSTTTERALIVITKNNPSNNPQFDQAKFIPVILQ